MPTGPQSALRTWGRVRRSTRPASVVSFLKQCLLPSILTAFQNAGLTALQKEGRSAVCPVRWPEDPPSDCPVGLRRGFCAGASERARPSQREFLVEVWSYCVFRVQAQQPVPSAGHATPEPTVCSRSSCRRLRLGVAGAGAGSPSVASVPVRLDTFELVEVPDSKWPKRKKKYIMCFLCF